MISNYSPQDVLITISHAPTNTTHSVGGLKADSFLTVESPNGEIGFEDLLRGEVVRVMKPNTTRKVTMKVDQGSNSNDVLSALQKYDLANPRGGKGLFTGTVTDTSGRSYINSSQCFLIPPSQQEYGANSGTREWVMIMVDCKYNIGGNSQLDLETQRILEAFGVNIDDSWKAM